MNLNLESFFSSRLVMHNAWVFNLFFLSCILYLFVHNGIIAWLDYKLEPEISIQAKTLTESKTDRSSTSPPLNSYDIIMKRNIFGGPARPPENVTEEPAPEEYNVDQIPLAKRLRLTLMGTVVSENSTLSRAIIADKNKRNEKIYREGDRIKNVMLVKILRNQVIIDTGKQEERLVMEMDQRSKNILENQPKLEEELATQVITVDRSLVESSMDNINTILRSAKIDQYTADDGTKGFQLNSIQDDSLFDRLGFQEQDVLIGVENRPLTNTKQVFSLYQQLKSKNNVNLEIIRNGEQQNLQFNIE